MIIVQIDRAQREDSNAGRILLIGRGGEELSMDYYIGTVQRGRILLFDRAARELSRAPLIAFLRPLQAKISISRGE